MKALDIDSGDVDARTTRPRSSSWAAAPPTTTPSCSARARMKSSSRYVDKGMIEDRGRPVGGQLGCRQRPQAHGEHPDRRSNNKIDAVVASNDGTALGALQAMKAQGLAGIVPISGQDATADGCNSIVKGELTVSILKDIRNLAPLAVDMADKLLKGKPVEGLKAVHHGRADQRPEPRPAMSMALFLPVEQVNKDNVYDLVVKSGFQAYDDVYRDIPADQRPPKP